MKWILVAGLAVLALLAVALGLVAAADPEGRGLQRVLVWWSGAAALVIAAGITAALV